MSEIKCPKCNSTQFTTANKGLFLNLLNICLNCGNKWKPGDTHPDTIEQNKKDTQAGQDAVLGFLVLIVVTAIIIFVIKSC